MTKSETMGQSTPMSLRRSVIAQFQKGKSKTQIAQNFGLNRGTVHTLVQRFESEGEQGLKPLYENCGRERPDETDFIYRAVRSMKTWHPGWGGEKIHAEISRMRPSLKLPSVRTFYRWFHWNDQVKPSSKVPRQPAQWAKRIHEGWQVDAKEEMRTTDGTKQCWLNIIDEHSGTVIDPTVFPLQEDL